MGVCVGGWVQGWTGTTPTIHIQNMAIRKKQTPAITRTHVILIHRFGVWLAGGWPAVWLRPAGVASRKYLEQGTARNEPVDLKLAGERSTLQLQADKQNGSVEGIN